MEEFLKDYVQMHVENMELEISEERLNQIVHYLMNEDSVWEVLDQTIQDKLEEGGK